MVFPATLSESMPSAAEEEGWTFRVKSGSDVGRFQPFLEMTCKNIIRWFKQQTRLSLSPASEASFLMELLELDMISAVF